jgi:hypothetical protein
MSNFHLHDEQTVNILRKITWASVFRFLFETTAYIFIYMYIYDLYIYVYIYLYIFLYMLLFSVCLLQTENENDTLPFVFCLWKRKVCFPWWANNKH